MALNNPPNGGVYQNATSNAKVFRQMTAAQTTSGIVDVGGYAVTPNGTPNMSVNVAAGRAWVPGSQVSNVGGYSFNTQGLYFALNDATVNLAISAANPTNPRIDLVVLQALDQEYSGTNNLVQLAVVAGTAAASPAAPAAPSNSLVLAQVYVAANATSVTSSNITDYRTYAAPASTASFQGRKNALINSFFDVWQRGTNFTASGYTADRWLFTLGTGAACNVAQGGGGSGGNIPGYARYYLNINRTTAGTSNTTVEQRIESATTFQGQTVTLTICANTAGGGSVDFFPTLVQNFGTGGTPSAPVTLTGATVTATAAMTTFTWTFAVPAVNGKTFGTNGNDYLSVVINRAWNATNGATGDLALFATQLELGAASTALEVLPIQKTVALCQRYFWQVTGSSASYSVFGTGLATGTTGAAIITKTPTTMRTVPALTYNNLTVTNSTGGPVACTGVTLNTNSTPDMAVLIASVASGLAAGQASIGYVNNTAGSYLALAAEL